MSKDEQGKKNEDLFRALAVRVKHNPKQYRETFFKCLEAVYQMIDADDEFEKNEILSKIEYPWSAFHKV